MDETAFRTLINTRYTDDWLRGAGFADDIFLHQQQKQSSDLISRAERLRLIHEILMDTEQKGGANLIPTDPDVLLLDAALFTPHRKTFNQKWLKTWSTRWWLTIDDLTFIQQELGTQVALYYAYLQYYTIALYILFVVPIKKNLFRKN